MFYKKFDVSIRIVCGWEEKLVIKFRWKVVVILRRDWKVYFVECRVELEVEVEEIFYIRKKCLRDLRNEVEMVKLVWRIIFVVRGKSYRVF